MSSFMASAELGSRIHFSGPDGYFTFRPSPRSAIFVATGTGIAPFVSMVRSGVESVTLLHGVRIPDELYYKSLFKKFKQNYIPCLSGTIPEPHPLSHVFRGRVTEYIGRFLNSGGYDFYLSGRSEMIRDVILLVDEKFSDSIVYTEAFF
jgi:NAD(P)H-flavin reductase